MGDQGDAGSGGSSRPLWAGGFAGAPDPGMWAYTSSLDVDRRLWAQLPSIPHSQPPGFLAWRQDLVNVEHNPTTEGPLWNAESWGFTAGTTAPAP